MFQGRPGGAHWLTSDCVCLRLASSGTLLPQANERRLQLRKLISPLLESELRTTWTGLPVLYAVFTAASWFRAGVKTTLASAPLALIDF